MPVQSLPLMHIIILENMKKRRMTTICTLWSIIKKLNQRMHHLNFTMKVQ
ncbi:MAG: hypothetical protein IPG09_00705 [Ignavibacteria bacterium]|nr:hypothetical protein [Ignavibacteria bacterium]